VAYEWTYGAVYSPKWLKGLTLSADWWHIENGYDESLATIKGRFWYVQLKKRF
jgi:hypothetical protein